MVRVRRSRSIKVETRTRKKRPWDSREICKVRGGETTWIRKSPKGVSWITSMAKRLKIKSVVEESKGKKICRVEELLDWARIRFLLCK